MTGWTTFIVGVVLLSAACNEVTGPNPDPTPSPVAATPTPRPARAIAGCSAAGGPSGVGCGVLPSFGEFSADRDMAIEIPYQAAFWTSGAQVHVLDDCDGPNAYSDPAGYILFGRNLFWKLRARGADLAIIGVLGHEFAHQIQFRHGWRTNPVRPMELEADALAGFYLGAAKGWAWHLVGSFFQSTYEIGDTAFNSPTHHGTPQERLAAARLGFDTGVYSLTYRRPFSWQELHWIFASAIGGRGLASGIDRADLPPELRDAGAWLERSEARDIARGTSGGSDVVPPRISEVERRALFPQP